MNITWLRLRIGFKVALGIILAAYVLLFVLMNKGKPVQLWLWFGQEKPVSLLASLVLGMIFGILLAGAGLIAWSTLGQIRTLRRLEKARAAASAGPAGATAAPAAPEAQPPAVKNEPEDGPDDESVYRLK